MLEQGRHIHHIYTHCIYHDYTCHHEEMKVRLMGKAQHDSVIRGLISSSNIFLEFYSWKGISSKMVHVQLHTLNLDVSFS